MCGILLAIIIPNFTMFNKDKKHYLSSETETIIFQACLQLNLCLVHIFSIRLQLPRNHFPDF